MQSKQALVPKLRFEDEDGNDYPDWEKKEFEDIASKSAQKHNPTKSSVDYPCVELESLSQETGQLLETFSSTEQKSIKNKFTEGQVLFGKLRPYLKKFLHAGFEGVCSSEIWVFDGVKVSNSFLYYLIQTHKFNQAANVSSGSKMPRSDWSYLSEIPFSYPSSRKEQTKIASFLTSLDDRIDQLKRKKSLLKDYKKGAMQKLFSQELRFKDEQGKDFPDWEEKKLEDVYTYQTTNSYSRDKLNYESGEVYNIHYGDIHTKFRCHFHLSNEYVPYLNPDIETDKIKPECFLQIGDIVLADASEDYADIGKSIEVIDLDEAEVVAGLHTYILRPDTSKISKGFGAYLMQARPTRLEVMRIAQGTKVLGLPKAYLSFITLNIPHSEEQTKIANFLSSLDQKIEQVDTQITQTQTFKKGLLQQMFV